MIKGRIRVVYLTESRKKSRPHALFIIHNSSFLPAGVFKIVSLGLPEVASIGKTEAQAREAGIDIDIGKFPFAPNGKALGAGHTDGFIKVITNKARGEIVGVHAIGYGVTDLIAEMSLAITSEATAHDVLAAVHPHPTLSEVMYEATAAALGEVVHI